MKYPGEELIVKMWTTLVDRGVGNLLRPWQLRREGEAQTDMRCRELIALAEAERVADEVRSGRRKLIDSKFTLSLTQSSAEGTASDVEPTSDVPPILIATQSIVADSIRKEVNVAKAVIHAENELKDDHANVPESGLDPDWLFRWRDYVGNVSSDELQGIWGRVLAGEFKAPGSYSFRLLEFIKSLTHDEAKDIEKVSAFVFGAFIARDSAQVLKEEGLPFGTLLKLQDIGIISGTESVGLNISLNSLKEDRFVYLLKCHERGLYIEHEDPLKKLKINVYKLTELGHQVMSLGRFTPNERYLISVGERIKGSGFKVSLVDCLPAASGEVFISNEKEID